LTCARLQVVKVAQSMLRAAADERFPPGLTRIVKEAGSPGRFYH
jgi:hypothetical protein